MQKSDTIGKLAEALSQAQSEFTCAIKDTENPYFKAKYADITSVFDACRQQLAKHGLSVCQPLTFTEEGKPIVETILMHTSGEWISGQLLLNPVKLDPQGTGSAITYGRRFSLESMLGIAREEADDDGNAASQPATGVLPPPPKAVEGGAKSAPPPPEDEDALREHLFTLTKKIARETGMVEEAWPGILHDLTMNKEGKFGKTKLSELPLDLIKKDGTHWSPLKAAVSKAEVALARIYKENEEGSTLG